jgi:hypothetical protein
LRLPCALGCATPPARSRRLSDHSRDSDTAGTFRSIAPHIAAPVAISAYLAVPPSNMRRRRTKKELELCGNDQVTPNRFTHARAILLEPPTSSIWYHGVRRRCVSDGRGIVITCGTRTRNGPMLWTPPTACATNLTCRGSSEARRAKRWAAKWPRSESRSSPQGIQTAPYFIF